MNTRTERLLPNGKPRYIRCYDNGGKTADQYTVVYTGRYTRHTGGRFWYVGMSAYPYHPRGFGYHGESETPIDRPTYSHLGKRITFEDLPADCQKLVRLDYAYLWDVD
jgi:hypothetical protein